MWLHIGIDTLVRAREQRVALFNFGIDPPVPTRPVGMLAKKTHASRNKDLHICLLGFDTDIANLHEFAENKNRHAIN